MPRILLFLLVLTSCAHRQLDHNHKPHSWTSGNHITTLVNGVEFYPAMLAAIRSAEKSITFETFAYVDAPITTQFTEALAQKATTGVKVHMILDAIGSKNLSPSHLSLLRRSGAEIHLCHPFNIFRPARTNNRTHRKILIVDGHTGFTGGAGFAQAWVTSWRDTQYRVTGPAVVQLQEAFAENWKELSGHELKGPSYFPKPKSTGPHRAQFIYDSPGNGVNPLANFFLHTINSAQKELILEQSYFIPNATFRKALLAAAKRGVMIKILLPGRIVDSAPTLYASQNYWRELLTAGIRIYQYQPSMMHGKLLISDEQLSIVGSGNLDDRSFFINDEANLHVLSKRFAKEQKDMFLQDLIHSQEVTLENLSSVLAPWYKRALSRLLAPQL